MKKNLTIVCSSQFGYLIDTYYYAKCLKNDYKIKYICIDSNLPNITEAGIEVITIKINKKGIFKWLEFVKKVRPYLKKNDIVFIKYFRFCSLLRTSIDKNNFIMDIRTGSIDPKALSRAVFNLTLRFEVCFASQINVISDSLAKQLGLKKYNVIPLGSPDFNNKVKDFETLRLVYVGTLSNRRIADTVVGLGKYISCNPKHDIDSYDIVGDGPNAEVEEMRRLVIDLNLENIVKVHGRIPHNMLEPFFEKCNLGISYVPKTSYFDVQPVTKTLEYIANGMAVIGTDTREQKKVLNKYNGIVCDDNPESFKTALLKFSEFKSTYSSNSIRLNTPRESWSEVAAMLKETLNTICGKGF